MAVGRARSGPLVELYEDYAGRLKGGLQLKEVEERRHLPPPELMAREAALIRSALPARAFLICLDSRGRTLSSEDFAALLGRLGGEGREIAFVIGGAEGLDPALRDEADCLLSLGPMTWPHLLVRVLLAEQLFRAQAILTGHPYHRG